MYSFTPSGVCASEITFDIEDGIVKNVCFVDGCNGNGKGIAALAEGRRADELIPLLRDIKCRGNDTSCPAQFAEALCEAITSVQ